MKLTKENIIEFLNSRLGNGVYVSRLITNNFYNYLVKPELTDDDFKTLISFMTTNGVIVKNSNGEYETSDGPEPGPTPPVPPIPTNRILYTAATKPESTWITNNCLENHFENGEGYLVLKDNVTSLDGVMDVQSGTIQTVFDDFIMQEPRMDNNVTSIVIPSQITSIDNGAFGALQNLKNVEFPNTLQTIGKSAFSSCMGLTSVTIPNSVTIIDVNAFRDCRDLTSVIIPNSVTSIGKYAFKDCPSLTSITCSWINSNDIPDITGNNVFNDTSENLVINIPQEANIQDYIDKGWPVLDPTSNRILYTATTQPTSTWITTNCSDNVFDAETGEGYLELNEGVTELATQSGKPAPNIFNDSGDDSNIATVVIPSQITSIGTYAFSGCSGLTLVTIPDSVTTIGDWAFTGCTGLTSVTVPNSVITIGEGAFSSCTSLTSAVIPNSVTSIGAQAFVHCSELTSVAIPNSISIVDSNTFNGCSGLTSIMIPNSVTSIGASAFSGCSGLTSVTIPDSVTSIDGNAFFNCKSLASVTCLATTPPTLSTYAFYGINTTECIVPEGTESDYADSAWGSYFKTFNGQSSENGLPEIDPDPMEPKN